MVNLICNVFAALHILLATHCRGHGSNGQLPSCLKLMTL